MRARRDTQIEASRLRRLSPLQTLEDQSQNLGDTLSLLHREGGASTLMETSYKTYVLRFTRESKFSFNQRIARIPPIRLCAPHARHTPPSRNSLASQRTREVFSISCQRSSPWCAEPRIQQLAFGIQGHCYGASAIRGRGPSGRPRQRPWQRPSPCMEVHHRCERLGGDLRVSVTCCRLSRRTRESTTTIDPRSVQR